MQAAGEIVGRALQAVRAAAAVGVSTLELDEVAEQTIRDAGAVPTFKGYGGFPGSICASVNDVIVHGIPSKDMLLAEGILFPSTAVPPSTAGWGIVRGRLASVSPAPKRRR